MSKIAGIQFEKDAKGNTTFVRFNLKKHDAVLQPVLKKLGIADNTDAFDAEWNEAITGNELNKKVQKLIKTWWKK